MAKTKFELYKDNKKQYRWRLIAQNGEPVASSGEGFTEKRTAMNAIKKLKDWASTDMIIDFEKIKEEAEKAKEKAKKEDMKLKDAAKNAKSKAPAKKADNKKSAPVKKSAPAKKPAKKSETKSQATEDVKSNTVI